MFEGILSNSFYKNTMGEWFIAFGIVLASVVGGKLLYWFLKNQVRKLTAKTESRLDDILIDMLEEPLVFGAIICGIWIGLDTLTLSSQMATWIARAYYILIIFNVAWFITRAFDAVVQEYLQPLVSATEGDLDDQLLPILRKGIKLAVWAAAIIIALNNAGYDVGALLAGLGIGGLAFALAAQDTVSNLFGGFTIFTDRPFSINDRVKIAGFDGVIQEIGIRSTRLKTLEGRMVTIPNSKITSAPTENVSSEPSRKVVLQLGLTYDTTPDQIERAQKLCREIADANESVLEDPITAFSAFGDFALTVTFIYYIKKDEDIFGTMNAMNLAILDKFNGAKLEFAFPTQTLHMLKAEQAP